MCDPFIISKIHLCKNVCTGGVKGRESEAPVCQVLRTMKVIPMKSSSPPCRKESKLVCYQLRIVEYRHIGSQRLQKSHNLYSKEEGTTVIPLIPCVDLCMYHKGSKLILAVLTYLEVIWAAIRCISLSATEMQ